MVVYPLFINLLHYPFSSHPVMMGTSTHLEHMDCDLEDGDLAICLTVVYQSPPSANNGLKNTVFLENELPILLANYATIPKDIVILGNLNFLLDIVADRDVQHFISIMVTHWMMS